MSKLVFVMSIPKHRSATGIDLLTNDRGQILNKTKIGRASTKLMALYSPSIGGLNNYISYNYYIDPKTNLPALNPDGSKITLQQHLEEKYNKPKGFYTNIAPRKDQKSSEHTFFQTTYWVMNDGTTVFDLNTELGEIGYYVCLGSTLVANSEVEYRQHKWPKAQFYIAIENESEQIRYTKNKAKRSAMANLEHELFQESWKRKFIVLLKLASTKSYLSLENVDNLLYDYIDKSGFTADSNINKFNSLFDLLKTAPGREKLEAMYLLQQAIDNGVVYEKQDTYTFIRPQGNIVIGNRHDEAIEFLTNPKKTPEIEQIQEFIKLKQSK